MSRAIDEIAMTLRFASNAGERVRTISARVPSLRRHVVDGDDLAAAQQGQVVEMRAAALRGHEREHVHADRLGGGVAIEPLGAAVPRLDRPVGQAARDRIARRLDDRREPRALSLGLAALTHVAEHRERALNLAGGVAERRGDHLDQHALAAPRSSASSTRDLGLACVAAGT